MKFYIIYFDNYYNKRFCQCVKFETRKDFLAYINAYGYIEAPSSCVKKIYGEAKWNDKKIWPLS
jgi:hypothetical protein